MSSAVQFVKKLNKDISMFNKYLQISPKSGFLAWRDLP